MDLIYFCIVTLIGSCFCGFANRAVLNAWFHGDLFDNVRKALSTRFAAMSLTDDPTAIETTPGEASDVPKPVAIPLHGWDRLVSYLPKRIVQLLLCQFCLPYHTAFWLYVVGWTPAMYLGNHGHMFLAGMWLAPVVGFAIVGVGQITRKQSSDPLADREYAGF